MPPVSAFIITFNEAAKIAACLDSLRWVAEIVVVDDNSSDATVEICRGYPNVRVFQHCFTGFKDQKSHAMGLTGNEWVLEIDADERVSPEMRESILALTPADFAAGSCFEFRRLTNFWGKWIRHASLYPDYKGRLFLVLEPAAGAPASGPDGEALELSEVRWNSERTAARTIATMSCG